MVVGGPPYQDFQLWARGFQDARNSLFKQFVRVVKITSPKIVILKMSLACLPIKTLLLCALYLNLEKLGYNASKVSADEFGVPSRRKGPL